MIKRSKDKGSCSMPQCGQPAKVAGMCSACYSWWNRVCLLSAREFTTYLDTAQFRATRTLSRLSHRPAVKVRRRAA